MPDRCGCYQSVSDYEYTMVSRCQQGIDLFLMIHPINLLWERSHDSGALLTPPLVRYDHDEQQGRAAMAGKEYGPTPGTPQAKRGGEAVKAKYRSAYYAEIGKKGGTVASERHGSEHYSRIGTKGNKAGKQRPHVP